VSRGERSPGVEPGKQWKFSATDLAERAHWHEYMRRSWPQVSEDESA
jgi:polyphosphate kinase 2 (PPK2 family)